MLCLQDKPATTWVHAVVSNTVCAACYTDSIAHYAVPRLMNLNQGLGSSRGSACSTIVAATSRSCSAFSRKRTPCARRFCHRYYCQNLGNVTKGRFLTLLHTDSVVGYTYASLAAWVVSTLPAPTHTHSQLAAARISSTRWHPSQHSRLQPQAAHPDQPLMLESMPDRAVEVRAAASAADAAEVAAFLASSFLAEVRGAGLTPAQWTELESEELTRDPAQWAHIGAPALRLPAILLLRG